MNARTRARNIGSMRFTSSESTEPFSLAELLEANPSDVVVADELIPALAALDERESLDFDLGAGGVVTYRRVR